MHRSGITVSEELKQAFSESGTAHTGLLKIQLKDENFVLVHKAAQAAALDSGLASAQAVLEEKSACYVLVKPENEDKWTMISFVPENAPVRDKMVYAASRAALKEGLGATSFSVDFFCSHKNECDMKHYLGAQRSDVIDHNILTAAELTKREAHAESMKAMSFGKVKMTAIADVPIQVSPEAQQYLQGFASKAHAAVLLTLDGQETLQGVPLAKGAPEEVAAKFTDSAPSYALFNFAHENESKQAAPGIFVYYCPDKAAPRQKMFYSSCKSMVLKVLEATGIQPEKRLEISDPKELTSQYVMDELYPKNAEKKGHAKPKKPGKGGARLHGASKFDHTA